ncbi:LOW QUALITY PROTEIN: period circadian protein homolog 1 [Puma concolor]|uniref:LOW QUALITY PROTEIN: period circadian protein homolog 1 n=1 Tax=Puma concolor TaxID=9696 RepID=A0A6P6HL70_PUMCO|nr:LOW QUALITY PROTEIN: period circadian protein homolog 1 [Puma concolor]
MRGSAWHYATRLLAPRSFHSAEGCNGGGQAAGGRSRGQVLPGIELLSSQRLASPTSLPQPGRPAPSCALVVASLPALFPPCPPHGADMNGPLEGADGGGDSGPGESFCPGGAPSPGPPQHRSCPGPSLADDTDANSNGSSGNESNGPESRGASQRSSHSSSSSGQPATLCLLETTESSKRCVGQCLREGEPAMDMSTYTLEELDTITASFSELLAPQDVGVFYGSTAPSRLPTWGAGASAGSGLKDFTQEKSVFCRIRGGPDRDSGPRYQPFRLTPYVTKIRVSDGAPAQPCCLLIAERIHSGYEAPRIPPDKRIFTTRHTPSCLFQDVDERAAPLLGYLPQDLLGAPVLLFLHPEDRPLMLAIHKKILQLAGQPFDHSPIRFCARNGEYVTMDTSWAGFVHPWSRKVAFVLGRHKVRTAPLNEDVFTPPAPSPALSLDSDIQELSEQIHRLLLQPVHSPSPTGLCGVGPAASPGPLLSPGSSSDSNGGDAEGPGPPAPVTFQQICKDVHLVKHQGQQLFIESRAWPPPRPRLPATGTFKAKTLSCQSPDPELEMVPAPVQAPLTLTPEEVERKEASGCSYQQINCLDSILRYLESCNIPSTTKRKCASSSCTTSSASDDDKQRTGPLPLGAKKDASAVLSGEGAAPQKEPVVGGALSPLALANKAESVVSVTSQCSFSSTIVHVGDKKPPESDIIMMEDLPGLAPGPAPSPAPSPTVAPDPAPDAYRPVGLTKAVLSLHTQKEEQAFLSRFRDLGRLRGLDGSSPAPLAPGERGCHHGPAPPGRRHHCRSKAKRTRVARASHAFKGTAPWAWVRVLPHFVGAVLRLGAGSENARTAPSAGLRRLARRDMASVLKQDRERLRAMQKQQPRFSEDQRRELGAVHSWVRKGQLPRALDVMACVDCGSSTRDPGHPDDPLFSELDGLGLEPMEEGGGEGGGGGGGSGEGEGGEEAGAQAGARASSSQDLAMEEEEQGGSPSSPALPATENGTS